MSSRMGQMRATSIIGYETHPLLRMLCLVALPGLEPVGRLEPSIRQRPSQETASVLVPRAFALGKQVTSCSCYNMIRGREHSYTAGKDLAFHTPHKERRSQKQLEGVHKYKIHPPRFTEERTAFEAEQRIQLSANLHYIWASTCAGQL